MTTKEAVCASEVKGGLNSAVVAVTASGPPPSSLSPQKASIGKALLATTTATVVSAEGHISFRSVLPSGYGFVILTAVGSVLLVTWKAMKVGMARDEYKVPYPQMYSSDNMAFNCVQRAHQNTLEIYPQFLFMLLVGGLEMPYFCTIGGWIWIMGRISYAKGYYTGDPHKRARGTFGFLGLVMLMAATTTLGLRSLGWTS